MITGKALLVVERNENKYRPFSVDVHLKTCSDEHSDYALEDLVLAAERDAPCNTLKVGQRAWIAVVYQIDYHRTEDYYSGGWDIDVEVSYRKIRILKRSPRR